MKNIFKLMGIAVLACGMMVACNKPENEDPDTPDNPQPEPQQTNKLSVSFGGNTWDAQASIFMNENQNGPFENYLALYAFKSASDMTNLTGGQAATNPYISGTLMTVVGEYDYTTSGGDFITYNDPTDTYYYGGDSQNDPGNYLRWNPVPDSFVENITAVDLNALTMSCTFSCDHFDLEQFEANGGSSYGTLSKMTGSMVNYHWTEWY